MSRKTKSKRNPAEFDSTVATVAEGWHGRKPFEAIDVDENVNYRDQLVCLGELEELEVLNEPLFLETGELKTLTFDRRKSKKVFLGGSSNRRQLFLIGGDQNLTDDSLEEFAEGPQAKKDKVSLGYIYSITYWTDKHHLEGSTGKHEAYMHCFGEQSFANPNARQDGQADYALWMPEEKLNAGVLPEIIYDRLNESLEIVGGVYELRDEGVWD